VHRDRAHLCPQRIYDVGTETAIILLVVLVGVALGDLALLRALKKRGRGGPGRTNGPGPPDAP